MKDTSEDKDLENKPVEVKDEEETQENYMAIGMCLGMAIGTAIGLAMGNMVLGMSMGMCVGMAIGISVKRNGDESVSLPGETGTKYTLAIFDLDGTLLYTLEDLGNSLNYALEQNGFPTRTMEEVRRFVGNGIRKLVERGTPADASAEDVEKVYAVFREHYAAHKDDTTRPYDGTQELLQRLRDAGLRLALVSNKAETATLGLCDKFFPGLFEAVVGGRDGRRLKPAPDPVDEVLTRLGVAREDAVYIGDSEVDIQTARNAGLDGITVSWGFRDVDFLKARGAKQIVDTPEELYSALTK